MLGARTQGETRAHGKTHIEEAALRAASTKGGGRLRRPPPFVDSFMDGCGEAVEAAEAAEPAIARISHDFPCFPVTPHDGIRYAILGNPISGTL